MHFDRRETCMLLLAVTATCVPTCTGAQQDMNFDPVATAKLRAGEIVREISGTERDRSVPEPSWDTIFNTGLLLQAGLRALLPVQERQGVALPGMPSSKDPPELIEAQENYKAVFESGIEATPAQKAIALQSIDSASKRLDAAGYRSFSRNVSAWARTQELTR
jgi:hypothetical protein